MTRRVVVVLAALLSALVAGLPAAAARRTDDDGLRVVTVLRQSGKDAMSVVAELDPPPSGALPADAAEVRAGGTSVPASTAPLLEAAAPTAMVLDASAEGAAALPQALSGAAGFLLGLPTGTPVTVTADRTPPTALTAGPTRPIDALRLVAGVRPGGARSTSAALDLALSGLHPLGGGRSLVLLQTTGPAPQDASEAGRLSERLRSAGAVLAVVTTTGLAPGWTTVAEPTGGVAVGAPPGTSAAAFDQVTRALRARSVVTFTPPSGAPSVNLRLRAGDAVLSSEVALASAAAAGSSTPSATTASPTASSASNGGRIVGIVVGALALLALVAAAVFVRQLLRGNPRSPSPATSDEHVPAGVRVFDMSDPDEPVELDPAAERAARADRANRRQVDDAEGEEDEEDEEDEDADGVEPAQTEADDRVDRDRADHDRHDRHDRETDDEDQGRDVHNRSA